uniref:Protein kinase domain-containing protein n=1 Tax=Oryzias latipes TaxID=8090 RepID=A0A3B3ILI4_ORYLA
MSRIERDIQGFDDLLPVVLKSGKRTYLRENKLGEGSFGKVLHYKIQDTSEDVAVKFIFREEGLEELKMLKKISAFDPDKNCFLKMLDHFEYESLICVVSEKLDQTFSDIILKRNQRPFDVCELRPVAQQLLVALRALKTIGLVHCDIKLNNVMFVNHQSYPYKVKLIDFGLVREKPSLRRISDIQIVGYKAPEVVFGCPLDEALDMWSVGCVLASMYKAKHFYPRTCLYDYIASIIHMQGQPPDNILLQGKRVYEFFKHANIKTGSVFSFRKPSEYMGSPINTFRSKVTDGFFEQSFTLDDLLNQRTTDINEDQSDVEEFKSLIKQMLCVDQKTRITPEEALNHNFITMKHLSERTKDPYVTSAREIMSVCEPVTTMQPDAPKSFFKKKNKRDPEHSVQNSTTGKSTCGHTGEKRRDVLKDFFARKHTFSAAKRREPTESKDSKDVVKRSTTSTRVPVGSPWQPLSGFSTCKNEGKETVTSLAKEPSTLCAAMGLEGLVHWHAVLWSSRHPTSPHLPRGAKRHPPRLPTAPSWAITSPLRDHLGQCKLPQNKPNQRGVHHFLNVCLPPYSPFLNPRGVLLILEMEGL